jgi:hypothetical protein
MEFKNGHDIIESFDGDLTTFVEKYKQKLDAIMQAIYIPVEAEIKETYTPEQIEIAKRQAKEHNQLRLDFTEMRQIHVDNGKTSINQGDLQLRPKVRQCFYCNSPLRCSDCNNQLINIATAAFYKTVGK